MNSFEKLFHLDVNDRVEKKKTGNTTLSYLSWAWAWAEVKKKFPEANYTIQKFENNLPYVYDEHTGYMVFTTVTIDGLTHEMWLPVMDGANKAMKKEKYTYQVINWNNGKRDGFKDKEVEAATMFDINKTIMRCLVKNLAMFGLGLYIYSGEDLPEGEPAKKVTGTQIKSLNTLIAALAKEVGKTEEETKQTLFKQIEYTGSVEELDEDQYGILLNKARVLKEKYEKINKEKANKKPEEEQESLFDGSTTTPKK